MNTRGQVVRDHSPRSEGGHRDRRVRRTQQALVHALVSLVAERRYESITIQDLLDRADVGRSTFYSHYRGKDDFLLRAFEGLLDRLDQSMRSDDHRLAPVRELFAHVDAQREFHRALARAKMLDRVYQAGTDQMSRTIERRLVAQSGDALRGVRATIAARAYAGAVFALLRWWLEERTPDTAERMDDVFHRLARDC